MVDATDLKSVSTWSTGSSPVARTFFCPSSSGVEQRAENPRVEDSSPSSGVQCDCLSLLTKSVPQLDFIVYGSTGLILLVGSVVSLLQMAVFFDTAFNLQACGIVKF